MRVPLHTDKAVTVLDYVKSLELSGGGIRAWAGKTLTRKLAAI